MEKAEFLADPAVAKWRSKYKQKSVKSKVDTLPDRYRWVPGQDIAECLKFKGLSPCVLVEWQRQARREDREFELLDLTQKYTSRSLGNSLRVTMPKININQLKIKEGDIPALSLTDGEFILRRIM